MNNYKKIILLSSSLLLLSGCGKIAKFKEPKNKGNYSEIKDNLSEMLVNAKLVSDKTPYEFECIDEFVMSSKTYKKTSSNKETDVCTVSSSAKTNIIYDKKHNASLFKVVGKSTTQEGEMTYAQSRNCSDYTFIGDYEGGRKGLTINKETEMIRGVYDWEDIDVFLDAQLEALDTIWDASLGYYFYDMDYSIDEMTEDGIVKAYLDGNMYTFEGYYEDEIHEIYAQTQVTITDKKITAYSKSTVKCEDSEHNLYYEETKEEACIIKPRNTKVKVPNYSDYVLDDQD